MAIDANIYVRTTPVEGVQGVLRSDRNQGPIERGTGQGVASPTVVTETPPANELAETSDVSLPQPYQEAIDSIYQLLSGLENSLASEEEEVLLARVAKKLRDLGVAIATETANLTKAQREVASEELRTIAEKVREQIAEAEKKAKENRIWGWVKAVFSVVAAIAAVALAVVTFGATAPVLVGAFCMAFVAVNDVVTQATGTGLVSHICQACGASEELAQKIELAVIIVATVVALVGLCGGVTAVANGIAAGATAGLNMGKAGLSALLNSGSRFGQTANAVANSKKIADTAGAVDKAQRAAKLADSGKKATDLARVEETVEKARQTATKLERLSYMVNAFATAGDGAVTIGHAVATSHATQLRAKVADSQGELKELLAVIEALDLLVKEVLEDQGEAMMVFAENIGKASESLSKKGDALMHAGKNIGKLLA